MASFDWMPNLFGIRRPSFHNWKFQSGFMVNVRAHILLLFLLIIGMLPTVCVSAQSWLPGYNYRKSISINKAQVSGAVALVDFPILISLTDPDLKYLVGQCNNNKLSNSAALDIAFATSLAPLSPLKFQIDSYDPGTGTLNCWINIPVLNASGGTAPGTVVYLYYGSNTLQDPLGPNALATWTSMYKLWHMNLDAVPAASMNAKFNTTSEMARGTGLMNGSNFSSGKIGTALMLNGSNESMNASRDTSTIFTISAWIKMAHVNVEQVLISDDSTGVGGYIIKVNASGNLTLDIKRGTSSAVSTLGAGTALLADQWYHIAITRDGKTKSIYINGKIAVATTRTEGVGAGGRISIGRSKQNDRYFGGMIDELQMFDKVKNLDWLKTEYNNQNDPASFYVVGLEEKNPVPTQTGYLFTAAKNSDWGEPLNWNLGRVPGPYSNVVVQALSKAIMRDAPELRLNQITIEAGASLTVQDMQLAVCKMQLNELASLNVPEGLGVQFNGDVVNDGLITTAENNGTVTFSGNQVSSSLSGLGSIRVFHLKINESVPANRVNFNQPVVVTGQLELKMGVLNSNGKITLAATESQAASHLPINSLSNANIVGDVTVEKYVSGSFPSPATARGWRLWSSPVYTTISNGSPEYDLTAYKNAIFVTGKGGALNGFDDSPQNGNTIFSHDQSIAGTLTQKYVPIQTMYDHLLLGKGLYVYSRGSRAGPDAFKNEVSTPPFVNPESYTIRYTGKLYCGDLKVAINSRNQKEPGEGFNLLGNPYASAIRWGSLLKENTTAFVWLYNPLNNAYDVSDDPELHIPLGAGFFVKVSAGMSAGAVTFKEDAKISGSTTSLSSALSVLPTAKMTNAKATSGLENIKLTAVISCGIFSQTYVLKLSPTGSDELTDEDALSLGDGYVSIAGLSTGNEKLMVDSRGLIDRKADVPLYVKGWRSGAYELDFAGLDGFQPGDSVVLVDKYSNSRILLTSASKHYTFQIDPAIPQSQGADRFSLQVRMGKHQSEIPVQVAGGAGDIRIYPNPFIDVINMSRRVTFQGALQVIIRDMMGKLVLLRDLVAIEESTYLSIDAGSLKKGLYIIEIRDKTQNKRLKSAKIIKL